MDVSSQSTVAPRHHHHRPHRLRALLSFGRNQIVSMDQTTDHDLQNLEHFHSIISDHLLSLLLPACPQTHLLCIPFLSKLLQSLLSLQSHFQSLLHQSLISNPSLLSRPPIDRLLSDHLDRAVKSLDVLNAVTQSLVSLRHSHRQADIAASALLRRPRDLNRAKAALAKLFSDANHRPTSFIRGLSFSSRCCVDAGSGLGLAVQSMNSILGFCMWTLMAAFGVVGGPLKVEIIEGLVALQERIWEEVKEKKKKKKGRTGIGLVELEEVERCGKGLMEEEEEEEELGKKAVEFGEACERLGGGLGEFERLLREVFHRILKSRVEVQQLLNQSSRASQGTA